MTLQKQRLMVNFDKDCFSDTEKTYSIKENRGRWMSLKEITQSEISQLQSNEDQGTDGYQNQGDRQ